MESTEHAPDLEGAIDSSVVAGTDNNARIAAALEAGDDGPAQATSVGLWGPSGMGKTQFAATVLLDPGYSPGLYIDVDGGRPALRAYENADLLVHRPATRIEDVERLIREVQAGRIVNRKGKRVRSVILDATSCILDNEIGARGLQVKEPKDQAQALGAPFKVLFGKLRALHKDYGITCVQVCHSKVKTAKVADVVTEFIVPAMFASIARPWMASLRHMWEITKSRGKKGPAYPIVSLRCEPRGVYGTATYVEYMKTSSIAFSQWLAGEMGKREDLQWDTGTMPVAEQPTLASLLRTAEALSEEQGMNAEHDINTVRAFAALQAVMDKAA